jgi:hypothetical protein
MQTIPLARGNKRGFFILTSGVQALFIPAAWIRVNPCLETMFFNSTVFSSEVQRTGVHPSVAGWTSER